MPGPLEGIKVVDLSAILSGPLAAMMLGDQGAEVVKVEPLGLGDLMRAGPVSRGGLSAFFAHANRGKRSIAVDITSDAGREIVVDLCRDADVFIQNFRPGAVDRLGIGDADIRAVQPDIIYASISGFGSSGPYSNRRVYDPIIQGLTGHVAAQINPEAPIRDLIRHVVVDKSSAYTAAQAITAALFARARGKGGQHIEIPMIDASLAFFFPDGMIAHTFPGEGVVRGPTLYELYRLWETADGHIIYFAASDKEVHGLFRALGHPEWCEHERFGTVPARAVPENQVELGTLLMTEIAKWPSAELMERLLEEEVPAAPVNDFEEVFADPQVLHNETVYEEQHPTAGTVRQCRPAARFSATPTSRQPLAPGHGEHTDEILESLGRDTRAREALREKGVVS